MNPKTPLNHLGINLILFPLLLLVTSTFVSAQTLTNSTAINITKIWSQEPNGYTYPIAIEVPTGAIPDGGFPVVILLHGNGGNGPGTLNGWRNKIDGHIFISPSGYMTSWNIADERSDAPDIEMIEELVDILQTYTNVNPNKIRVLGTSNGSALCNRILIENKDSGIDIICAVVSQLNEAQYHNGDFYSPSGETGDPAPFEGYDVIQTPLTGRKYLTICNENDPTIPYTGGRSVGVEFLDAQEAAYLVAQSQGYNGAQLTGPGTQLDASNVYEFKYLDGQVTHLKGDAFHGTNTTQTDYINAYFNGESTPSGGDKVFTDASAITITKTWSQQPSGYTYPMFVHVPSGAAPEGGFPACILLHGNGGQGEGMRNAWRNNLGQTHILVSPSGYERSWNIAEEVSNAPDVEMVSDLIDSLQTYSNINPSKIRILGSSNGSALANRVLVENKDTGVDIICGIVSQLTEASYHNGGFYLPSGETGDPAAFEGYDTPTTPISGRRYLNVLNENDGLIPYTGGYSNPIGTTYLDGQEAAFIVAQSQGYSGNQISGDGVQIETSTVYEYSYLSGQVVLLKGDAMHGTNQTQREYIVDYFNNATPITNSCETDLNLTTIVSAGTYQASNEINCNSAIMPNATVTFEAGFINLTAGFSVEANTNFTAIIAPCSEFNSNTTAKNRMDFSLFIDKIEVEEHLKKGIINIYPNPTNSIINIQGDFTEPLNYSLISPLGQRIKAGSLISNSEQIDLSFLPDNIYFLNVGNQTFKIRKLE